MPISTRRERIIDEALRVLGGVRVYRLGSILLAFTASGHFVAAAVDVAGDDERRDGGLQGITLASWLVHTPTAAPRASSSRRRRARRGRIPAPSAAVA